MSETIEERAIKYAQYQNDRRGFIPGYNGETKDAWIDGYKANESELSTLKAKLEEKDARIEKLQQVIELGVKQDLDKLRIHYEAKLEKAEAALEKVNKDHVEAFKSDSWEGMHDANDYANEALKELRG